MAWRLSEASAANTLVALPLLYVVYDFFYTLFHRALHHRSLYRHIHKHHHRQKAPSRGNTDAVNVHPFEFLSGCVRFPPKKNECLRARTPTRPTDSKPKPTNGPHREYNHLLAIHLVAQFLPSLHALTVLVFIVLGGFLASLNHTRFDIKAPGVLDLLYQVRVGPASLFCLPRMKGRVNDSLPYSDPPKKPHQKTHKRLKKRR